MYAYPRLDTLVWASSMPAPTIGHILAFDADAGAVAFEDSRGAARSIDFRLGAVTLPLPTKLSGLRSADAWNVFGVATDGSVIRITPSENRGAVPPMSWRFKPTAPAREVIPQNDGALVIMADSGKSTYLWRLFPPEQRVTESIVLPRVRDVIRTSLGDRLYFTVDSGVIGVESRRLRLVPSVRIRQAIHTVVATPSGDRLFVSVAAQKELYVIDRYQNEVSKKIRLPVLVSDLRMDPLGRFVLARSVGSDSVWVVAIGTSRVVGAVRSSWRTDLPTVAPDGAIAVAMGGDVTLIDGETLKPRTRIPRGAADYWFFFLWSGFRPRALGLDQPVSFATTDNPDSVIAPPLTMNLDTGAAGRGAGGAANGASTGASADTVPALSGVPLQRPVGGAAQGFTVQFAALLDKDNAQKLAVTIRAKDQVARVVPLALDGATLYRVVLGPYATRDEAETAAKSVGKTFIVFEGPP